MGSPGASLLVWAVCGLLATLGARCYAELGALVPESGGEYTCILRTFGCLPTFLVTYMFVLVGRPVTIAAISLSFAEYVLVPFYPGCSSLPQAMLKVVAATCILLLMLFNCWSSQMAALLMNVCTTTQVFLLVIVVGGAVVLGEGRGCMEALLAAFHNTSQQAGHIRMAFYQCLWSFDGWNSLSQVMEELNNSKVPIIIPATMVFASVYLVLVPIVAHPQPEFLYVFLFLLSGFLVYFLFVYFRYQPECLQVVTLHLQLLMEVAPTTKNAD
ncbi:hypothetical protein JEQ12_013679 [Ovis aries]|uniref:B(0,+)-type amino acid transporter 1-like n=1 Tax=Ovis aries TaxID=9940 RepID=A0A836D4L6_SHEEP|nr:hypothetical protein JEQ12_013679 [Ovis aries]